MSTQPEQAALYNDKDHWQHVLDYLFVPAILKAGFEAIPPETRGGDVIHRNIMNNLGDADLVLCDMSALNANVFFELGIRTALNKPVAAIVDKLSLPVPFDTGVGQYHTYDPALNAWSNSSEIEKLEKHTREVCEFSNGENSIWATFGFARIATMPELEANTSDFQSIVMSRLQRITEQIERTHTPQSAPLVKRFISQARPAVTARQVASELSEYQQTGTLDITIEREVYIATGSGKLDPPMVAVPHMEVRLVQGPIGANVDAILIRPGTGTTFDFNITMKSMEYGVHLPLGTFVFEYRARVEQTTEQGGAPNS
jgi:hypothetical protein